ncbi:MAG: VCBS repeat-containing protein [Proteobacteria bacterium]|nr:VCBS repeat-containing protein [Pseudomonadota bacterium]
MNKYFKILLAGVAVSFFGCDDASDEQQKPEEPKYECLNSSECDSGICVEGKCAKYVGLGDACDSVHLCNEPYECVEGACAEHVVDEPEKPECTKDAECDSGKCQADGTCASVPKGNGKEGDSCGDDAPCDFPLTCDGTCKAIECTEEDQGDCPSGTICENDRCEAIVYLKAGEACVADSSVRVCEGELSCIKGVCGEIVKDGTCETASDCTDAETPVCLPSGKCGAVVEPGGFCNEQYVCPEGFVCEIFCKHIRQKGESCDEEAYDFCEESLACKHNVCVAFEYDLPRGAECNDEYKFCEKSLECVEGACAEYVGEDASCNASEHILCKAGLECIKDVCTPVGGGCSKSSDCLEKDSFCCQSDSCGAKNKCVPYNEEITYDEACRFTTKPGIFEAQVQCRWQPPADAYPKSSKVEMPPLVGHFGNKDGLETVVAFFSYFTRASEPTSDQLLGVIRFINPDTCETLESVRYNLMRHGKNWPAAADMDGDGLLEFLTFDASGHILAFKWNATNKRHEKLWQSKVANKGYYINVFDVDGNGQPEVVVGTTVLDGRTGKTIYEGGALGGYNVAIGIFDNDPTGQAMLVSQKDVLKWNKAKKDWTTVATLPSSLAYKAYADFGTPGATAEDFDYTKLDGFPEIVAGGSSKLHLYALVSNGDGTYGVQTLMSVDGFTTGGPITIGDFDSDGLPEIGVASKGLFGVYDPRCKGYEAGKCADKNVLWERWSQDASSGATGSSLFDFDGDGQAEAVYADECFTRVYEGKSGRVLFSAKRSSGTTYEAPVVADIDGDGSAEILMGSDNNKTCADDTGELINPNSPGKSNCVDPIHEGIRCLDDEDCPTGKGCNKEIGLCICTSDADCNTQIAPGKDTILQQYVCAPPIHPEVGIMTNEKAAKARTMKQPIGTRPDGWKKGDYQVCRATRLTKDIGVGDLMIFKDRLDRWVSSRPLWNQHSYNIINIEDNGRTPTPTQWIWNWLLKNPKQTIVGTNYQRPVYNNYRLNKQGQYGAGVVPDITGRFIAGSICGQTEDGRHVISGKLCNRGTKPVSMNLPATFFYYEEEAPDHRGQKICTSYTKSNVGVGECAQVGCEITADELKALEGKTVLMVSNLDENGYPSTVECNADNNIDMTTIDKCASEEDAPIVIVN